MKITATFHEGRCAAMRCIDGAVGDVMGLCFDREEARVPLCERHLSNAVQDFKLDEVPDSYSRFTTGETTVAATLPAPDDDWTLRASLEKEAVEAGDALAAAKTFAIETQEDLEFAAEMLAETKGHWKRLDERRKLLTQPMNAAIKSANDLFRPALNYYSAVEFELKARIAEATQRQEAQNQAAIDAAAAAHALGDGDATQAALAKVINVGNVSGVQTRDVWDFEVTHEAEVPRKYLSVDVDKIRAAMKEHALGGMVLEIKGVRFFQRTQVASRSA